ncbi:LysR family transcriptional regulator [Halomonas sp. BL6]|uniref:LysR family transcriptional regulator n=1 Tax=Halomonas sp. BL6 TaxID=2585770 RepID=UPI001119BA32|nr:LysR family transcriptional regulator [Halomonas sp. BL6]TNH14121.1 LysR family transcriptional regulator [Halomonas sp. BL6]
MRFMGLDLNLLVVFKALMEHRSVTETARRLNLTQPAVSNALQRLRDYFKDDLFVPTGNRMVPTTFAERLSEPVRGILADTGTMLTAARPFDAATSDRRYVIGASDHTTAVVIAPALNDIFQAAPNIRIDTVQLIEDQWSALENGDVDMHILPYEFGSPNQTTIRLYSDKYVVLCDRDNVAVRDNMTLTELRQFTVIGALMAVPRKMRGGFSPQLGARLIDHASLTAKEYSQLPFMLEDSDRIAIVPRRLALRFCERFRLTCFNLPSDSPTLNMVLQINKTRENDAGLSWLIRHFVAACQSSMSQ